MSSPAILLIVTAVAVASIMALLLRQRTARRRHATALALVLDAADALEERLRVTRLEIEAIAGSDDNPVRDAMHEMLRQRLWLQQYGGGASLQQLDAVRDSIVAARKQIDQQLLQIERARAPLH